MDLEISNVFIKFNKGTDSSFSLSIPRIALRRGSITFLMGHNGSGKSLLLRLLTGEVVPHQKIKFSTSVTIGIVRQFASENLAQELTVEENLLIRLHPKSIFQRLFPKRGFKEVVDNILRKHQTLQNKKEQIVETLSGGQKQALAFYATMIKEPDLICLDEFLSATDERTTELLLNEINTVIANKYILIVSHDLDLAMKTADKIIILKDGSVSEIIEREEINKWNEENLRKCLTQ